MIGIDLGADLLRAGRVTEADLDEARAAINGGSLAEALVRLNKVREEEILGLYGREMGLEVRSEIADQSLDFELVKRVPIQYARRNSVFPLTLTEDRLEVAVSDAGRLDILSDLRLLYGAPSIVPVLVPKRAIQSAINRAYGQGGDDDTSEIIQDLDQRDEEVLSGLENEGGADLLDETSDAPVIKLVNHILSQAVKAHASDIHVEPFPHELRIRFRLDGVLHNKISLSRRLHSAVVSRIKIMAKLNIAEKRLPQDGRIEIKIGERQVDLRVSTIPTGFGERVVLRLLEKGMRLLKLNEIGLGEDQLEAMGRLITISHGIVLVTGPTGSGKTTTLYAALNEINSPDKNILTIEDPIEYQLDGIGQMQANSKIGLTFARGLRAMVRQDPDVILIGEIRDLETAEIAIQAALTGHLVFSTLHTNDSASAVTRLIDMGIEPFLVSSSVRAIIAQRLVRRVCSTCREPYTPRPEQLGEWGLDQAGGFFHRAHGCPECLETGYRGRTGIYEFLPVGEEIANMILKTSDANQIRRRASELGMRTLREDGLLKAAQGLTTVSEILRVTQV
ncbi:MAG: type II secretion system protein GspE [Deltaproteobacteria bacterium]|nr:type II secretion system protein GspE [Deltaproteobacteria bacterium]